MATNSSLGVSQGQDAKVATVAIDEDGETRHVARTIEMAPKATAGNWVITGGSNGSQSSLVDISGATKGFFIHVEAGYGY